MEHQRRSVTKRVDMWGSVYIIGGTDASGELLSLEQADDLIARFDHDQALFARTIATSVSPLPLPEKPLHMKDGDYLARVVDGNVEILHHK